ncbi:MAG: RDD family protein [Acidobacteria bacterium]|nr:RDD family protein [Acidobacteriota bacterium]
MRSECGPDAQAPPPPIVAATVPAEVSPAPPACGPAGAPPESAPWRQEVSVRVERFRQRRQAQATLPLAFDPSEALSFAPAPATARSGTGIPAGATRKVIPFEDIRKARKAAVQGPRSQAQGPPPDVRPTLDLGPGTLDPARRTLNLTRPPGSIVSASPATQASLAFPEPPPSSPLALIEKAVNFPVAPLAARVMSAVFDAALVAVGCALFAGIYTALGGRFALQRAGVLAFCAAMALLAGVYLFLFLFYAAATPGMRWLGLRLVDFEGRPARPGQRLLRVLAVVPSSAALGFGFLWAAFDEEALAWHDRISRTCLTMTGSPFLKPR